MTVKGKIINIRSQAAEREDDARIREAAMAGVQFLAAFLMAAARIFGGQAPFGVAMVAQAGPKMRGAGALAGAALGYLATGGIEWGVRYAAASVLAFTVRFVFQEMKGTSAEWFPPLISAAVMALTGALGGIVSGAGFVNTVILIAVESALCALGAYFFREALSEEERSTEAAETRHLAAVVVFIACALMGVARVRVVNSVSLGRFLALILVMTASLKGGALSGAAAGTALGLAMDAASGTPFYTMAYSFAGLVSGVFSRHGRLPFLLVFILTSSVAVLAAWSGGAKVDALFETFAASVVFMLIPPTALNRLGGLITPMSAGRGESGLRRCAARRVEGIAKAYGDVCQVVRRATESVNDNDVAKVFDRAADVSCVKCVKKNDCWNKDYADTLDSLNAASGKMMGRSRLMESDLSARFRENCAHLPEFIAAVNGELRAMAYRKQYRSRLEESRAAAWGQYEDFSGILRDVSKELSGFNGADPLAERRLVRYLRSQDVEADAAVFRDAGGRLRAVIESGRLSVLTRDPAYLDKLSGVLGVRLCRPAGGGEGRMTLLEAEPLSVSVGIAAMRKKGEEVCGDRGTYFKTDSGVLCVVLSDGMGSGREAALESVEAVAILEKFLRSGVEPAAAMKILNSVMLLRNGEEWGFATVDLMCIDLFSGDAGFYKYGAAPSYVKTGRTVRRVSGESLAAGLMTGEGAAPDVVRMRLKPGSLAVIASDGAIPGDDDGWLRELMQEGDDKEVKTIAREVLRKAEDQYGRTDDMTVLAVRVGVRA